MIRRMLAVLVLFLGQASFAFAGEFAELYMPNADQEKVYVSLELIIPSKDAPASRKKAMQELKSSLAKFFHPAGKGDPKENNAKCIVRVHQLSAGDIPAYRLSCWSRVPGNTEWLHKEIDEAASPLEVLAFSRRVAEKHQRRMQSPAPMKDRPPHLPTGRTISV